MVVVVVKVDKDWIEDLTFVDIEVGVSEEVGRAVVNSKDSGELEP